MPYIHSSDMSDWNGKNQALLNLLFQTDFHCKHPLYRTIYTMTHVNTPYVIRYFQFKNRNSILSIHRLQRSINSPIKTILTVNTYSYSPATDAAVLNDFRSISMIGCSRNCTTNAFATANRYVNVFKNITVNRTLFVNANTTCI